MSNMPLVTIIVPVYNVEPYLRKCLDSLLSQTYQQIEVITVDDGSTDASGAICEEYALLDNRIRIIHKENGGLSDARNTGIDHAAGQYLMFLDSDDYLSSQAVEHLVNTALKTDSKIAHMKSYIVDANYQIVNNQSDDSGNITVVSSHEYIRGMCEKTRSESVCDKLFDIQLFSDRRFEKGRLNEDFFFLAQLLFEDLQIGIVEYPGYNYYQRHGSITNSGFSKSLVDAVKNSYELMELSVEKCKDLEPYFARLLLFQARTLFITIPWESVVNCDPAYMQTYQYLHETRGFIKKANLKIADKLLLYAVDRIPRPTIYLLAKLWKIKNRGKL